MSFAHFGSRGFLLPRPFNFFSHRRRARAAKRFRSFTAFSFFHTPFIKVGSWHSPPPFFPFQRLFPTRNRWWAELSLAILDGPPPISPELVGPFFLGCPFYRTSPILAPFPFFRANSCFDSMGPARFSRSFCSAVSSTPRFFVSEKPLATLSSALSPPLSEVATGVVVGPATFRSFFQLR